MAHARICTMPGCSKPQFSRQWCAGHYHRWRKHGDPMGGRWPVTGCSVDGCGVPHKARGYCSDHYVAFRRHGDPLYRSERTPPGALLEWIKANTASEAEQCLEWPFAKYSNGYGHLTYGGMDTTAHRVMCLLAHGDPPAHGMEAAHSCHNRGCCNPRHLRWATKQENMADKADAGTEPRGEKNGAALINEDDVRQIRGLRGRVGQLELAARFGITKSNVSAIQLRKSWKHVE